MPYTIDELLQQLNDPSSMVRQKALGSLRFRKDVSLPDELINELIHDPDPQTREVAFEYLQWRDSPRHTEYLIGALSDDKIRWKAVRHLSQFPDPRAIEPLKSILLNIEDYNLTPEYINEAQESVISALGYCADYQCRVWLLNLVRSDTMTKFASSICSALTRQHDATTMTALIELLQSNKQEIVCGAVLGLSRIGDQRTTEPLLATLKQYHDDNKILFWLIPALARTKDIRALDALLELLKDPRPFIPTYLVPELGNFNDPRILQELESRLHMDENHRDGAILALGKIPGPESMDLLLAAFQLEAHPRLIRVCVRTFMSRQDPRAIPALQRKLRLTHDKRTQTEISDTLEKLRITTQGN